MIRSTLIFLLILSSFTMVFAQSPISVMTYNIKLDYPKEGENSWTNRKPFFIDQIKFYEPDILGVQEAMPNQMNDMDSLLEEYAYVGVGRDDGKDEGEYSAIFYKMNELKILESSTFWLSKTPDKVSMGWDAAFKRVCTYALFENQKTKQKFWVFNTHFDHVGVEARKNSTTLIIQKIKDINTNNYPVMLTGDFNMEPSDESIQVILQSLNDAKVAAENTFGPKGTFNSFQFDQPVTRRIDYIFTSEDVVVNKYAVLSDNENLLYPSDHLPVYVEFAFEK